MPRSFGRLGDDVVRVLKGLSQTRSPTTTPVDQGTEFVSPKLDRLARLSHQVVSGLG